jgi:hypothetical protein
VARGATGIDDAAAGIEQRPFGVRHQLDRRLDLVDVTLEPGPVALVLEFVRLGIQALGELDVLRDIDDDRPGSPARRHIEGLVQHARQIGDILDEIVVLGARAGDAHGVAFLECVVADQMGRHLAGDAHDRNGIHQRIGQSRDGVCGPRPRRHQDAADLAGGAGIALGRVHGALFVTHKDVANLVLLEQLVVDRQHRSTRIAEQVLDALVRQGLDHHLGAGHFPCHCLKLRFLSSCGNKKGPEKGPSTTAPPPASRHGPGSGSAPPTITKLRSITITRTKIAANIVAAVQKSSSQCCGSAGADAFTASGKAAR